MLNDGMARLNAHRELAVRYLRAKGIHEESICLGRDPEPLVNILLEFTDLTGRRLQTATELLFDVMTRSPAPIFIDRSNIGWPSVNMSRPSSTEDALPGPTE